MKVWELIILLPLGFLGILGIIWAIVKVVVWAL